MSIAELGASNIHATTRSHKALAATDGVLRHSTVTPA